eukprot:364915-Chlamydomonas_euryale.AAC.20
MHRQGHGRCTSSGTADAPAAARQMHQQRHGGCTSSGTADAPAGARRMHQHGGCASRSVGIV